ncbi:MAG: hypothetical protein LH615_07475 [Ferruginibacter sp.]|nr:hypothetical protein [Ferruginibacter sp.]
MKILKFITPFFLAFPVCIVLAVKTWMGDFTAVSLTPNKSALFIAMGFTMVIIDLFLKYLIGKDKIHYAWVIETAIIIILCIMIIPRIYSEHYG